MQDKTMPAKELDRYQGSDFLPHLNKVFCIRIEGSEPIELKLVQVTEGHQAYQPGERHPFSLQFLGPVSSKYLIQHIYRLENEETGDLELFIVPVGLETGRMRYEAIFS